MSRETALAFVKAVNDHNVPAITALMSDGHIFIDAYGRTQSREEMLAGWPGYFRWFPDYRIEVEEIMENSESIGLFGFASGTWQNRQAPDSRFHWRLPACWRVVVKNGKVKVWQVYCDSKIPYETMERE